MSNLISRTSFLEATGSLFTSEKIATARTKIVEWLNEAQTANPKIIVENITKAQELIINSDVELLEEFLDDVLAFAQKPIQEIRRAVVGFIEEVCKTQIQLLPRVITVLAMSIRDESPQVKKRLIQAFAAIYRNALKWIASSVEITDDMENAWNTICMIKAQILDMIDNDNDGIRTNAIKFLEGVILLQSYIDEDSMKRENDFSLEDIPLTVKIVRRRKLEDEANNIFDLLIKFHGASHISSVNLIACMGTLCTVAKSRPTFMLSVIEAIKNLLSNLPPTLTDSQVNSVKKHMKMQLTNIIKQPSAFEYQSMIGTILTELGVSNSEISRALPKLDRQEKNRRLKRAQENANALAQASKKIKLTPKEQDERPINILSIDRPMEIDLDEIAEQKIKSNNINQKFINENLKTTEMVVNLVMKTMQHLPSDCPQHFILNYHPIANLTISNQTKRIAELLAEQMTEKKIGPGSSAITKEPPMRLKVSLEDEKIIIQSAKKIDDVEVAEEKEDEDVIMEVDENEMRKEDATKKLRETLERVKGEQMIPKMKQRVKTLKLQEVTKPLEKSVKEKFLIDVIKRVLGSEKQCIIGGVASKRRRIVTVIAATFSTPVRQVIMDFITEDLKNRIDIGFAWLYEEYSLFQGFTRHTYIKSEHKPDFPYNQLLSTIINKTIEMPDGKDKEKLLKKIYLEAPIISDEAIKLLVDMCELLELSNCGMELLKELALKRPPKQSKFLAALLKYSVHENFEIREKAITNIVELYSEYKIQKGRIESFASAWLQYLENSAPPSEIFDPEYGRTEILHIWSEDLAKTCLALTLAIMPYHQEFIHNLSNVYATTSSDMKRTVLKSIESSIRKMGIDSSDILKLIEQCPKGSETLVTRIVYILTEKTEPTLILVEKVRDLYQNKVPDVRLLIPILSGLNKKEIILALPKFLKLNPVVVKEVFNRLLNIGNDIKNTVTSITPAELLIALHTIDSKVELKFVVKATSICLSEKEIYTQEVLAAVLQQLVEISPLPTLLMRTVIQSLTLYPRLSNFIVNLLQRLLVKQVWKQKVVWDGFLKCCQRLQPQTLSILIQLPAAQLIDTIASCPELREPLLNHANTINENHHGHVSEQILCILGGGNGSGNKDIKDEDVFDVNIKVELADGDDDPDEMKFQPLPPGED